MGLSIREPQQKTSRLAATLYAAVLIQLAIELVIGFILSTSYKGSSTAAYASASALHRWPLRPLQAFHYWDSSLLILETLGLLVVLTWCGAYRSPIRRAYSASVLLAACSIGFQMSGNLLPGDRHGVQTATIEASIAARVPEIGPTLHSLALGGPSFGDKTLPLWYELHWLLLAVALIGAGLAYADRRTLFEERPSKVALGLMVLIPVGLSVIVASPFGSAATAADATAYQDQASWYTWPLHGALQMFGRVNPSLGWVGAVLLPTMVAFALVLMPWLRPKLPLRVARGAMIAIGCLFLGAGAFFGGGVAPLTGTRDPAAIAAGPIGKVTPPIPALAQLGRQLFATQGCADCHGKDGIAGNSGPALAIIYKQHPDAEFYEKYIHNPKSLDPSSTMPPFPSLTAAQLQQLADFVRTPRG